MYTINRVLVPLDGSTRSEAILTQVGKLLKREDLEVVLLRVVDPTPAQHSSHTAHLVADELGEAGNYLDGVAGRLAEQGVRVRCVSREGLVGETILETVREVKASLIAMSTHGYKGLSRWVLGSIAEKVIRASDVPVLLMRSFKSVRPEAEPWGVEERPVRRILVPVDGSPESLDVAPAAEAFARMFRAEIELLHVEVPLGMPTTVIPGLPGEPPPLHPPSESPESAENTVRAAAERFGSLGSAVRTVTARGDVAGRILHTAESDGADLIAMTTHGRSGISRWVLGSNTEKVLRAASVPMLVVRCRRRAAA